MRSIVPFPTRSGNQYTLQSVNTVGGRGFTVTLASQGKDVKPMRKGGGKERMEQSEEEEKKHRRKEEGREGKNKGWERRNEGEREGRRKKEGRKETKEGDRPEGKRKGRRNQRWKLSVFDIYQILKHTHSISQWANGQGLCFCLWVCFQL